MARTTIIRHKCDGCGTMLAKPSDGLVIHGQVYAADDCDAPLVGPTSPGPNSLAETALCWACWHARVLDPARAQARRERRDAEAASDASARALAYEQGDTYARNGASGPQPPPDLPHAVATARALAGARDDDAR